MNLGQEVGRVKQGDYTRTIYTWIKDGQYKEAISFLNEQHTSNPSSRPALSMLGYCYFLTQDFANATQCYEQLVQLYPDVEHYKVNYAQCLYQSCMYEEAMRATFQFDEQSTHKQQILKLQAAIKYGEEDLGASRTLVEQITIDDNDKEVNLGCILFKENRLEESLSKFITSLQMQGYKPDLSYNMALCYYQMKQYPSAMKHIGDIIERGIREHPELSVGMSTEGIDVRSVGNTITLHETALVEAFNLKAAIEYQLKNFEAAQEALTDMPPRTEEELDAVTLHNQALISMDTDPSEGFEKLQFLIQQNPFPPETFANLLLLYCKYEYYDLAADVMAENAHFTYKYLTPYLYEFLDALITQQTSPEDAYRKFDEMATKHSDALRKLMKKVQDAKQTQNEENVKKAVAEYENTLELYIPILMSQARIYWDLEYYEQVEKVFRKSVEFCNEHDTWKVNVAHVLFLQENKFKEATGFYEPLVKKSYDNILNVNAMVLANLCVSYIMTGQNEDAEELMRKIEKEEEQLAYSSPDKKIYHLCTVNLVIGTLYCSKGNYEFGISRVIKSLEPYNKKLGTDTWFYSKRCFLALLENLAKQVIVIRDSVLEECLQFLTHCEEYGHDIKAIVEPPLELETLNPGKNSVAYEARLLKALLFQIMQ
ncbi:tetratricopeptide repeat protein 30A-like protein [Leptotrombidium deliense]|uniref:Tetratricopeptide repeat protein 30 n=1 Tax=Leptotrombidium deliense TaxID=299467 RepID=A0A443SU59_9ACAR|nr:tetratricopeptide repeat protein 30A-like protein [Leptotrombidium deliense]